MKELKEKIKCFDTAKTIIKCFDTPEAKRFWIMKLDATNKQKVMLLNYFNVYFL